MSTIDLVWLGRQESAPAWRLGSTHCTPASPAGFAAGVERCSEGNPQAFVVAAADFGVPDDDLVRAIADRPGDLWHAGLSLGLSGLPGLLNLLRPTWMLNADADPGLVSTSWRLAPQRCVVRTEVARALGGPDPSFDTLSGAGLEWGLRLIRGGAVLRHSPELAPSEISAVERPTLEDEIRIVNKTWGRAWLAWVACRLVRHGRFGPALASARALRRPSVARAPLTPYRTGGVVDLDMAAWHDRISVVVPTLDRYPYLEVVLGQLAVQTVRPKEVIVVDQTQPPVRRHVDSGWCPQMDLRVLELDVVGQCTARNAALEAATGDYVLFVDDDDEVPENLIETHLEIIIGCGADASCGGVDEVGAGPPPEGFLHRRVSDVFPTNNTLLRVDSLAASGLFDLRFDKGTNEDHDLGMRLYLNGALLTFDPDARVLHHRAPRGGLREHGQRVVTRASSRQSYLERRLPTASELYMYMRYFTAEQVDEHLALSAATTLRRSGSSSQKLARVITGLLLMPDTMARLRRTRGSAREMLREGALIPQLPRRRSQGG